MKAFALIAALLFCASSFAGEAKTVKLPTQTHSLHVGWRWAKPKTGAKQRSAWTAITPTWPATASDMKSCVARAR